MREDLLYPSREAVRSVLRKIGIDPDFRVDNFDQDYEYTTCRVEELEKYVELYLKNETTDMEKRVLGCFILRYLNDYLEENESAHPTQAEVLEFLHADIDIHEREIAYWSNIENLDEENRWEITKYLIQWRSLQQDMY